MFKKKCGKCSSKISKGFDFCPHCGFNLKGDYKKEDYGMLGRDDEVEEVMNNMPGVFGGGMINKMLSGAIKMLEKEIQKEMKNMPKQEESNLPKSNFQLYVNGKKVDVGEIKPGQIIKLPINNKGDITSKPQKKMKKTINGLPTPPTEVLKKSIKLPRKEAEGKLKRFNDKIVYEMEVPGLENEENVLINHLEKGYEVRAFAKDKVYQKNIPLNLRLVEYYLKKPKLFLEFQNK